MFIIILKSDRRQFISFMLGESLLPHSSPFHTWGSILPHLLRGNSGRRHVLLPPPLLAFPHRKGAADPNSEKVKIGHPPVGLYFSVGPG